MEERARTLNDRPFRTNARYVLYWSQMNRRTEFNHALARAVQTANEQGLPVLFYEGLTCSYPYANDRLHTFLLEGVPDTAAALERLGIGYVFFLRRKRTDPDDALYQLARDAAAVITDDYPTFIARRHNANVPFKLDIPYTVVDSSCVVPMSRMEKREYAAYTIRPKIRRLLPGYLKAPESLKVRRRFEGPVPAIHTAVGREQIAELVAGCDIDHSVRPSITWHGGAVQGRRQLKHFLENNLRRYAREKNEPSAHATSGMSAYLHFGHISALEIALEAKAYAEEHKLIADEFLEELIVRRELAFNHARFSDDPASVDTLPGWARSTLDKHASDPRNPLYARDQLDQCATHDPLWNATQTELLLRGTIHGYYRMYWGKKILEWAPSYRDAVDWMVYFHDRYALDGRDPNTYTNILWCLGLHDRPWSERSIFGMVRYMSYDGMRRKTDTVAYLKEIEYLERTGADAFAYNSR